MAPTPVTANYRLTFSYTVDGLTHHQRFYLDCTASADPSGYDTIARAGFGAVGVSTIADFWFDKHKTFYDPTDTSFDQWLLEHLVGTAFVYTAAGPITIVPTGTGTYAKGSMEAWSGKDTANRPMNVYFYEKFFPGFAKYSSYAALSTANKAIVDVLFNVSGTAGDVDPAAWRRSRGGLFSQRWLAYVTDSNEKLRRMRGIK